MRTLAVLFIGLTLLASSVYGALEVLRFDTSARSVGLGQATVSIDNGVNGMDINPASLSFLKHMNFSFSHLEWMSGGPLDSPFRLETFKMGFPLKHLGTTGVNIKYMFTGTETYNSLAGGQPYDLSFNDIMVSVPYARMIFKIPVGISISYFREKIGTASGDGFTGAVGAIYQLKGFSFGLAVSDIGIGPKFYNESEPSPVSIRGGVSYTMDKLKNFKILISSDGKYVIDEVFQGFLGLEMSFWDIVYLRGGYSLGYESDSFSVGMGLSKRIGFFDSVIDYSSRPLGEFGYSHLGQLTMKYIKRQRIIWELEEDERLRIAVNDLLPGGVSGRVGAVISDILRSELIKYPVFQVIERAMMAEILAEQALQLSGCTENECAVQIGRLLSAHKTIVGELNKLGDKYMLSVRIVDVATGEAEVSAREKFDNIDNAEGAVEKLVKKIIDQVLPEDIE